MRTMGTGVAAVLAVAFFGAFASAQTLTVGSKNFVEQYVVAELYAASLEEAGFKVSRMMNMGSTQMVHNALRKGVIDLYPEYTGTGLVVVMNALVVGENDPQKVYAVVKEHYEKEFKLTWLKPSGVNNGRVMVVRAETAEELNLKTLSDLAKVSGRMILGAGSEFGERRDGLIGLKEIYGIEFADFRRFPAVRVRYKALTTKEIDVVGGFATDPQIAAEKLVILKDDKVLFPPYFLAPVVRSNVANYPKAVEALERVGALIDNSTMQELIGQVVLYDKEPRQVAVEFLKSKGILH